jgi:uncharacterized protein YraI
VVKVEGMGQEEAAVVAVAVRGGAGNDLPQVVGIANDQSIAYGCAKAFRELGAELAITFLVWRLR